MDDVTRYNIFISSPSDADEERKNVSAVLPYVGKALSEKKIALEPINWKDDLTLGVGNAQQKINDELIPSADLCIAIIKHKLGTPVNNSKSGTVNEINEFMALKKNIYLYVYEDKNNPLDEKARNFVGSIKDELVYYEYENVEDLKFKLYYDLIKMFSSAKCPIGGENIKTLIQFNPNDTHINSIMSENVVSLTDLGVLYFAINFESKIDPTQLTVTGYPKTPQYEFVNGTQPTGSVHIKFTAPCPDIVTIQLKQ